MTGFSINTADAKEQFSELLNRVTHHHEHIILTRRGKEIAAIVPYSDLLQFLEMQHKSDKEEAMIALKQSREEGVTAALNAATPYSVKIAPAALKQIQRLEQKDQKAILPLIEALSVNPRPPGVYKIEGMTGLYSEDVDHMRIVYKVEEQEVLLLLVK